MLPTFLAEACPLPQIRRRAQDVVIVGLALLTAHLIDLQKNNS